MKVPALHSLEAEMFIHTAVLVTVLLGFGNAEPSGPSARVAVDEAEDRVVVEIGPLEVSTGMHYQHVGPDENAAFTWPADGWIQGYRIDLVDSSGRILPREMLHHAGVANLSRRQLSTTTALRLFAVGQETDPVTLPSWMGMRMWAGEELMAYFMVVNESHVPIEGAVLRITLAWRPADVDMRSTPTMVTGKAAHPSRRFRRWEPSFTEVVPIVLYADLNQYDRTQFDVGPGVSTVSTDVVLPLGGFIRAVGGHMHDYASEMRLEDVETGEVLVRLEADVDDAGHILRVEEKRFPFMLHGVRLEAGRQYRIVSVYDNPTGAVLTGAGMAYMAGAFIPDDLDRWPELEAQDPRYLHDVAGLTGEGAGSGAHHSEMMTEGVGHSH